MNIGPVAQLADCCLHREVASNACLRDTGQLSGVRHAAYQAVGNGHNLVHHRARIGSGRGGVLISHQPEHRLHSSPQLTQDTRSIPPVSNSGQTEK